jgi:hypothetical protein
MSLITWHSIFRFYGENYERGRRMKLGIHAYAWCSQWSDDTLHLIDRVKSLGLDFIEIPLM